MWQGIVVQPGGVLVMGSQSGPTSNSRTPLIEDAKVAVDIQNPSTASTAILQCTNTIFNRNQIGIRINNYQNTSATAYPFIITGCIFTCRDIPFVPLSIAWPYTSTLKTLVTVSSPLQTPYINNTTYSQTNTNAFLRAPFAGQKSLRGIDLVQVGPPATTSSFVYREILIGGSGAIAANIFDNHFFGVYAERSNVKVVNSIFQNTIIDRGNGGTGIYATALNDNHRLLVNGTTTEPNRFFDCTSAITCLNYLDVGITFNDFRSTQVYSSASTTLGGRGETGVALTTNRYRVYNVSDNKLYNISNGITFSANTGYYLVSGSPQATNGQYSGQLDINRNTIARHLTGNTITTQFVRNGIRVSNILNISSLVVLPGSTVKAEYNSIDGAFRGIFFTNWQGKDLSTSNNTITLVQEVVNTNPNPTQYGISHTNNIAAVQNGINNNAITGFNTTRINQYGIYCSLSNKQTLLCNSTTNLYMGLSFNGNCSPTTTNSNKMSNLKYGFVLDNNGIIGQQGSPTAPCDNEYLGPQTWPAGTYKTLVSGGSNAINSIMYVRSTGVYNPNGSGLNILPSLTNFIYSNPTTLMYVTGDPPLAACSSIGSGTAAIVSMEAIATAPISATNTAQTDAVAKNQMYRVLKTDPTLIANSPTLQTFYTNSQTTTRQTFMAIEGDLTEGDFVNGTNQVAFIAPQNSFESNYKSVYDAYIKHASDTVTISDSLTLVTIALGCPFTDGAAVYEARALYNSIYHTNVNFEDNCLPISSGNRMSGEIDSTNTMLLNAALYPNPSSGEVTLDLPQRIEKVQVIVTDITGKEVYNEQVVAKENRILINLNIESGIYLVRVIDIVSLKQSIHRLTIQQ